VFAFENGALVQQANFFGIEDLNFRGGHCHPGQRRRRWPARSGGQGGPTSGPRIAVFSSAGLTSGAAPLQRLLRLRGSLPPRTWVAVGDIDGDSKGDLIFGGGPGGGPPCSSERRGRGRQRPGRSTPLVLAAFFGERAECVSIGPRRRRRLDLAVGSSEGSPTAVRTYLGKAFRRRAGRTAAERDVRLVRHRGPDQRRLRGIEGRSSSGQRARAPRAIRGRERNHVH
jgi:hypothetical protein